jgi:hypothetical protein
MVWRGKSIKRRFAAALYAIKNSNRLSIEFVPDVTEGTLNFFKVTPFQQIGRRLFTSRMIQKRISLAIQIPLLSGERGEDGPFQRAVQRMHSE